MVLPNVTIHTGNELTIRNYFLLLTVLLTVFSLLHQEEIIRLWHPFVVSEESTTCKVNNFSLGRLEGQIGVLLVAHSLCNSVWHQVWWQVTQRGIISSSETLLNLVLLFIGEIIKKLSQVWKLIMTN